MGASLIFSFGVGRFMLDKNGPTPYNAWEWRMGKYAESKGTVFIASVIFIKFAIFCPLYFVNKCLIKPSVCVRRFWVELCPPRMVQRCIWNHIVRVGRYARPPILAGIITSVPIHLPPPDVRRTLLSCHILRWIQAIRVPLLTPWFCPAVKRWRVHAATTVIGREPNASRVRAAPVVCN